ncbi:MAG: DUF5711 family protein [bacterium]|nr:DUF5711 family protein [bacterium]
MATIQKRGLHTVEVNKDELNKKIRRHRQRIAILMLLAFLLIVIAGIALYIYAQSKTYDEYEVITATDRADTSAAQFRIFHNNLLKYTNDGAVYTDRNGNLVWNQTYEMDRPMLAMRDSYVAIYELNGNQIYIMDTVNLQGSIHTSMPIQKVSIAKQGTVAVLMESEGVSYLQLYDKLGNQLAAGELHVQNSGYPLDIALSETGEKLAVSILDINEGNVKTTIAFYNFGVVGQNSIDKIVGSYSYSDVMIPQIEYLSGDIMVGFGDDRVLLFTGEQKPVEEKNIRFEQQIKSIFYNENYFGVIYDGEGTGKQYCAQLYEKTGSRALEILFDMDYTTVEILGNKEICIRNENDCEIYNLRGTKKFSYSFPEHLYMIIPEKVSSEYTLIIEGQTQLVKLK